jgi:sporulation protein YqfC
LSRGNLKNQIASALEVPGEVAQDEVRLVISGNSLMTVENHKGLVEYDEKRISIRIKSHFLNIEGENLLLNNIHPDELALEGVFRSILFISREKD